MNSFGYENQYLDIFAALAAPFASEEVRVRPQGNRQIQYITARTAMNRLDEILGPAAWWDDYTPQETCVVCRLTIRLPDGREVTKVDAGGHAGMSDEGDDEKSGYSDAFKRAAVKFGIGRYLYRDGVPPFVNAILSGHETPRERNTDGPGSGLPSTGKALFAWLKQCGEQDGTDYVKRVAEYGEKQGWPAKMVDYSVEQIAKAVSRVLDARKPKAS